VVEHRQGPATRALAPVKKTIYSLNDLRDILRRCNRRYLEYLSSLDDFSAGIRALDRLTQPRAINGRMDLPRFRGEMRALGSGSLALRHVILRLLAFFGSAPGGAILPSRPAP
jgi:hypothetical protein